MTMITIMITIISLSSVTIQPVFVSQKINDLLKIHEKKLSIVNR